jgi:large subunit ribosomal protein L24
MEQRYHIRKGDTVEVRSGKEKGKRGKVLKVDHKTRRALVEKLNFKKRHYRPGTPAAPQGGIMEREGPIRLPVLMLVCPKCQKRTRPRFLKLPTGTRIRVCRSCAEHID